MGYYFRLAARVLLYASSHTQDNTYLGLCYTSCGALAEREIFLFNGKERGSVLFNDALNTFYLQLYGVGPINNVEETRFRQYMCCYFRLAARDIFCSPSYSKDSTYHVLCYTSKSSKCISLICFFCWKYLKQICGISYTCGGGLGRDLILNRERDVAPW